MKRLLIALSGIGILDSFSPKKAKEYRLANSYTLCAIALMSTNFMAFSFFGLYEGALTCFLATLGLSGSFFFTQHQQIRFAEMVAVASNNFGILMAVLFYGEKLWSHLYLVLLIIAYMVIFGERYTRRRNSWIVVSILVFILCFFSGDGIFGTAGLSPAGEWILSRMTLFLVTATMLLFFYAAVRQNRTSEKRLSGIARKAESERQAKSEFLSVMSHEIRTPLNAILGVGSLLSTAASHEEQQQNIRILNTSSNQLLALVNDILDFNKLEEGKLEVYQFELELRELLENTFQMFAHQAENKGLNYQFRFDEAIESTVKTDGSKINQVISNLLSNAIKFSESGTVTLYVNLVKQIAKGQTVEFVVEDSGIGISQEKQSEIFEVFTQAGSEISVRYGGTGLGLTISKRVLELLGGKIEVESEPGKGSKFSFQLFLETLPKTKAHGHKVKRTPDECLKDVRVLLAEDNLVNQTIMRMFFEKWKSHIRIASDGLEALKFLEEETFDMVIMDIQMPRMDGIEAAKRIRDSKKPYSQIPIVALTADVTQEMKEKVDCSGMNALITKPFVPDMLMKTLCGLLGD